MNVTHILGESAPWRLRHNVKWKYFQQKTQRLKVRESWICVFAKSDLGRHFGIFLMPGCLFKFWRTGKEFLQLEPLSSFCRNKWLQSATNRSWIHQRADTTVVLLLRLLKIKVRKRAKLPFQLTPRVLWGAMLDSTTHKVTRRVNCGFSAVNGSPESQGSRLNDIRKGVNDHVKTCAVF